jgi:D-aminoacyl-tRNA deacylase
MRALLQRVSKAQVKVDNKIVGKINSGWLIFLGVHKLDSEKDVIYLHKKIKSLRGFSDDQGKMNLSLTDCKKEVLIVSQFTLYADCKKGNRPGFSNSAPPDKAKKLYEQFCELFAQDLTVVEKGVFAADMKVELTNDGPVTFLIES